MTNNFVVHSNEMACRKTGHLGLDQVEYISLIQVIRDVISFMELIKEVYYMFDIHITKPEVFCKAFEDNQGCIADAESNKLFPGTKHITNKYHHF